MKKITNTTRATLLSFLASMIFFAGASFGQTFSPIAGYISDLGRSAVAWADYDNDQDLDLLISGLGTNGLPSTLLYENIEGTLTLVQNSMTGYKETAAAWGDMDNDGDLDLLLSGNTESGDQTRIYRNDAGTFFEIDPGMINVQNGDVCWMDYDNDGDLDAFVTGNWMAKIYQNQEGNFVDIGQEFGAFSSSAADWGDFDNDGDLDLLLLGDSGAGAITKIFRNDRGDFHEVNANLNGLMAGCVDWVDYDNDGDLDASIAGNDDALEAQYYLYKNNGDGQFDLVDEDFEGFALGDADWGDYDNDGDLDLIYSGKCTGCGVNVSGIFRNDGDDTFYHRIEVFPALMRSALQWADFDNDGDLDFIISGTTYGGTPQTYMYRNDDGSNTFQPNSPPTVPGGLSAGLNERNVTLSWEKSTDDETLQSALSYNVRVGKTSGGCEVVTDMAMAKNGFRKISRNGNTGLVNSLSLEKLDPGVYYWSVQSIDQAFLGSGFAPEQTFEVVVTSVENFTPGITIPVYPNPAHDRVSISPEILEDAVSVSITDLSGRKFIEEKISDQQSTFDVSTLAPGMYLVLVRGTNSSSSCKLLIR